MAKDQTQISDQEASTSHCKIYWDYHGPSATRTAEHFLHHLDEWIERHSFAGLVVSTGTESNPPTHSAAFCVAPLSIGEQIFRSLKAHRAVYVDIHADRQR